MKTTKFSKKVNQLIDLGESVRASKVYEVDMPMENFFVGYNVTRRLPTSAGKLPEVYSEFESLFSYFSHKGFIMTGELAATLKNSENDYRLDNDLKEKIEDALDEKITKRIIKKLEEVKYN